MSRKTTLVGFLLTALLLARPGVLQAQSTREAALARGVKLPAPFGIGLSIYTQDQSYAIDKLSLGIPGIDPAIAKNLKVDNRTKAAHLTADYWLLPFLDIYGILGQVQGTTHVKLSQINLGVPLQDIDVEYRGLLYGAGMVLAFGGKHVFGTLDLDYTNTRLDVETSAVKAWLATPRIGYDFGNASVWLGAMYENPQERHRGTFNVPYLGPVPYDVTLGAENKWSYLAGLSTGFGPHWVLTLEGGFGPRTSALAHLDYRF
jgi:hypothetical protein